MREINEFTRKFQGVTLNDKMKKYKIDIAILGDGAVGKSAILRKWIGGDFSESYIPTVSETLEKRTRRRRSVCDTSELDLRIYDTCGSMAFPAMNRVTISRSDAFIIVYSVDSEKSFECAQRLIRDVSEIKNLERIPLVIIGNKADLSEKRKISFDRGLQLAVEAKAPFMEVSAKTGRNIEDMFYSLFKRFDTVALLSSPDFRWTRTARQSKKFLGMKIGSKHILNERFDQEGRERSSTFT